MKTDRRDDGHGPPAGLVAADAVADRGASGRSPAPERPWLALIFIALAQLMVALDATIVNIALPSAQADLGFSDPERQWVITGYTLAFGGLLLLGGRVADSIGRRRALLLGLAGFAVASAASGAAPTMPALVAARVVQGVFAALLAPTALSLLAVTFTAPRDRAKAFAVYGAVATGGAAVGLVLGGFLAQYLGWRWCLYVNVPIAVAAAAGARLTLPGGRPKPSLGRGFDVLGVVLGGGGLVALVYGCGQAARRGLTATDALAPLAGGLVLLVLFGFQEARAERPLLPPRVVVDRRRSAAYLSVVLAIAGMFGAFLSLTYELQAVLGLAPLSAGLAFLPISAATVIGSAGIAGRLLPRVAPRTLMVPGFLVAAAGMGVLTQLRATSGYLGGVLPAEVLLGLGIACVMAPAASVATGGVEPQDAGAASAALQTFQQVGASLGTAVMNAAAAGVTASYVASGAAATRDALVAGYAAAATYGLVFLVAGAAVALALREPPENDTNGTTPASAPGEAR